VEKLLADELKEPWQRVEQKELLTEKFRLEQERSVGEYRKTWTAALVMKGFHDLQKSLFYELGLYTKCDPAEVQLRCIRAVKNLAQEWRKNVNPRDRKSIEQFYNESQLEIYDLIWWHTLSEDFPLADVTALQFALREGCRSSLVRLGNRRRLASLCAA
jgi:hypothetical protein